MELDNLNIPYRAIKDGDSLKDIGTKLNIDDNAVSGLIELLKIEGFQIDIKEKDGNSCVNKRGIHRIDKKIKPELDELEHIKLGIVSDTQMGCTMEQLHMINDAYKRFNEEGITKVLHCGDVVDGDYRNKRPAWPYQEFAQGFEQQEMNVVENYPLVEGIDTYFICGSHDETHFINGGADLGKSIERGRKDMHYLGMDKAIFMAGKNKNVPIMMSHPGGGVSKSLSYKPQEDINKFNTGTKPKILLQGHYHKSYYMFYRNVHAFLFPCLVGLSPFMRRMNMNNVMGYYILNIYVNKNGEIQYIEPEEYLFDSKDEVENDYLKTKQLVIKKTKLNK